VRKLADLGVETAPVVYDPQRTTLVKQRLMVNGQLLLRCDQGDVTPLTSETEQRLIRRLRKLARQCDAILVSDYDYGILTQRVVRMIGKLCAEHNLLLAVDSKRLRKFRFCAPTVVKPNYEQVIDLLRLKPQGDGQRYQQIQKVQSELLQATGAQIVAATLDREGALIVAQGQECYRTYAQPVADANTIGAGDTYISAFTLALAAGATAQAAAELAARAGKLVVQTPGTTPCWHEQLRAALAEKPDKRLASREQLARLIEQQRNQGKRIVFTNGCFDLIHPGHVDYLEKAKALGDLLIVGVNTDESVQRYKGPARPINPLEHRLQVLAGLAAVDYVIEFWEDTPIELIKIIQPDIYVKGGDYREEWLPEAAVVRQLGGAVELIPFLAGYSTTRIIHKIKQPEAQPTGLSGSGLTSNVLDGLLEPAWETPCSEKEDYG